MISRISLSSPFRGFFLKRTFSSNTLDNTTYHKLADEALDYLSGEFEEAGEKLSGAIPGYDVEYSMGVLKVSIPTPNYGVLVLNKQPPNKQIWLSSPISYFFLFDLIFRGPKRFDFDLAKRIWIYPREQIELASLLNEELKDFTKGLKLKIPTTVLSDK
jgi:frataxin